MRLPPMILATLLAVTAASTAHATPITAASKEGLALIVSGTGPVVATYQGSSAGSSGAMYLSMSASAPGLGGVAFDTFIFNNQTSTVGSNVRLGSFAPGTELILRLFVTDTGFSYFTGDATRNPDGTAHARVQARWMAGESLVSFEHFLGGPGGSSDMSVSITDTGTTETSVPEPSSMLLLATALPALAFRRWRQTA